MVDGGGGFLLGEGLYSLGASVRPLSGHLVSTYRRSTLVLVSKDETQIMFIYLEI